MEELALSPSSERKPYRRRFIRSEEPVPFRLQEGDIMILAHLATRRFLTLPMLVLLTGRAYTNLSVRLSKMYDHGLVDKPREQRHYLRPHNSPVVYALANGGAKLLMDRDLMEQGSRLDWDYNNREVQHPHIDHELLINRIAICMERGAEAQQGVQLIASKRAFSSKIRVFVPELGHAKSVEMDWWFLFEYESGDFKLCLLEADRGTERHKHFGEKVSAYWQWHISKGAPAFFRGEPHLRELGVKGLQRFQVLTVCDTPRGSAPEERRDNLAKSAKELANSPRGSYQYLFASHKDISLDNPESVYGKIFCAPPDYDAKTDTFKNWISLLD